VTDSPQVALRHPPTAGLAACFAKPSVIPKPLKPGVRRELSSEICEWRTELVECVGDSFSIVGSLWIWSRTGFAFFIFLVDTIMIHTNQKRAMKEVE
jgi:hypothetical protein